MVLGFISGLLWRLGFIATLAGLAPLSYTLFDKLTCNETTARVTAVRGDQVMIDFSASDGQTVRTVTTAGKIGLTRYIPPAPGMPSGNLYPGSELAAVPGKMVQIIYRGVGKEAGPYVSTASSEVGKVSFAVFATGLLVFLMGYGLRKLHLNMA